ncbi:MAG: alpha-ketoacid dehydrogenase subunit beta [Candidatus Sericytochromatia bacterium]|nr:alpha-ketoacid dehydrogenase subunit beta [Candidatus Sericytochromatia bacterium]
MPVMNIVQAVNDALREEMTADDRTVVFGEDVGKVGGVFRTTAGLQETFGVDRVVDTPLSEGSILGCAVGMALYGMRPIAEIQFADFIFPGFDQIVNEMAKYRYRTGGQFKMPVTVRTPYGGGIKGGHYHSQSPESYFTNTPGLKVVMPSNPHDAKGLLIAAIRDEDPVIVMEPKLIYRTVKGEVPAGTYTVPIGKAAVARPGEHVTIIAYGAMTHNALQAANIVASEGIEAEVIDLRTLVPLDIETVVASVVKTGRVIIVHEAPRTSGYGAELVAVVNEHCFLHLEAPPLRITGYDTPFPYSLDHEYMPTPAKIAGGIRRTVSY